MSWRGRISSVRRIKAGKSRKRRRRDLELLENRRLLAAHIVGNAAVFTTIQAAVDAASAGQTVTVDAGRYPEQVSIFKQLTLKGAQAGVDGRSNARGSGESILTGFDSGGGVVTASFKIGANGVTVDGFTVQGTTSTSDTTGGAIVINPNIAGTTIINNVVQNNAAGILASNNSAASPLLIQRNAFLFNNLAGPYTGAAIAANGTISGGNFTNVTIDSNYFFKNYGTTVLEPAINFQTL